MELNRYRELQCSHAVGVDKLGTIGGLVRMTLQDLTANAVKQVVMGVNSLTRTGTDRLALLRRQLLARAVLLPHQPMFGKLKDVVVGRRLIELNWPPI